MKLLALVKGPASIALYLATECEAAEVLHRSPGRGPPYWKSRVLRLKALGDETSERLVIHGLAMRGFTSSNNEEHGQYSR